MRRTLRWAAQAAWDRLTAHGKLLNANAAYVAALAEVQGESDKLRRTLDQCLARNERLRKLRDEANATIEEQANDLTQLRGKLEATQRQNARLAKPKLASKPCSVEDRSQPPPGYSVHERHVDVWWANADLGSQESRAEAVAAAWEHHDAIAKRAREQGWNACLVHLQAVVNVVAEDAGNDWSVEDVAGFVEEAIHDEGADDLRGRAEKAERERDEAQQRLRHLCVVAKDISGRSDPDGAPVLGVVRKALKQLKHERDEARTTAASAAAQLVMRVGGLANRHKDAIATTRRVFADFKRVDEALDYLEQHEAAAARKADAEREEQAK